MIDPVSGAVGAVADAVVSRLLTTATQQFNTGADAFLNPITFKDPAESQFRNDFYKLLMWNKRYSPFLRGRGAELNKLVEWADGTERQKGTGLQIAILSGAGGAGKSRLAAELAVKLAEERNFVAGTLKRGADNLPPKKPPGNFAKSLLAIIDYAEERIEHVKAALERFANWGDDPGRGVRVLLLARSGQEEMLTAAIRRLDLADALMHLELPVLGSLPVEEALALANDVRSCLSGKEPFKEVAEEVFTESCRWWLEGEDADETNRLPLHVMAAALHALERPDEGFTLSGNKLLKALAEREIRRASGISEGQGLGEHTLPRLIALATLAGGLGTEKLHRLKGTLLFDRLDVEAVKNTPWWDSGRSMLTPLEPDRPAAAFVAEALLTGNGFDAEALPKWLAVVLEGREKGFCQRLSRLDHDIRSFSVEAAENLTQAFEKTIEYWFETVDATKAEEVKNTPAAAFVSIMQEKDYSLALCKVFGERMLAKHAPSKELRGMHLNNLSAHLSEAGQREEALEKAQEAVNIRRQLAEQNPQTFLPYLATSLNNLANILSELGRREEALEKAQEAADIYRQLAEQNPQAFLPYLAGSFNNLANRLSELGRRKEALEKAKTAVDIYRQLAEKNPQAFLPDLAMSLNNLTAFLSELGRREEALEKAQEAADIYRQLAEQNPQAFLPYLATSLNNLANILSELGRCEEALEHAQDAINIRRQLAEQNPQAFRPDLARSQGVLGSVYVAMERFHEAAEAFGEGLRAIAQPLQQLPAAHAPLATALLQFYLDACEKAGREPDEALVRPIVEVLERALREE